MDATPRSLPEVRASFIISTCFNILDSYCVEVVMLTGGKALQSVMKTISCCEDNILLRSI